MTSTPGPGDEFLLDIPIVREFIAHARATMRENAGGPERGLDLLRAWFGALLAEQTWLPEPFARANPQSGMGGGIGQWLLYRAGDGSLSLFSLVVPSGQTTPVHDHLAWGLVGLYRGEQAETVYRRTDSSESEGRARLEVEMTRVIRPGDFYVLLPPDGDIHAVSTTSAEPSISIHLLGNDAGCVWRHAFDPEAQTVRVFRSGYSNRACD